MISNDLLDLIQQEDFQLFLSKNEQNCISIEDQQEFVRYIEQLSSLDQIHFPDQLFEIIQ